ncbi:integration host factor subunit alpha [Sphingobium yanoikuyae]|uniref:Integration host factor subunit alpha n=1 Tax=Sphingobium yanoikuyae TaxID=13690 RepID=A0A9X7U6Q4_SPHYA|nr:integration host factor subunit alpha [Sphingobium yanoikuyae]QNG44718.1 integration host factor subunit alpha [Sphingobium yanoikuyae]
MSDLLTLTRADIAHSIYRRTRLPRAHCQAMVDAILQHIADALAAGENVKITNFGTFILRDKGERLGRNPNNGTEVSIAPRRVVTFRASNALRDAVF